MTGFPEVGGSFGRYQITGILGRGGMGVVFSAIQGGLDRTVALKVLSPELATDPRFRNRFIREANALASLDSPHIMHIYEHGEQNGCLFIATQLVRGGDLRQRLDENGGLPPRQALEIVAQVSSALVDAHAAGVIHRDIKPGNVLLRRSEHGDTFAYLCDFGIAQTGQERTTRTGGLVGTLGYTAPERHEGADASVQTDIYALGCLLWATLTGSPPYRGTDVQVATAHLRSRAPSWPGDDLTSRSINAVIRRSLAKRPEDRYPSATLMRADLLGAIATVTRPGSTVAAAPTDVTGRSRLFLAGWATVVAVAVLVGIVALAQPDDPASTKPENRPERDVATRGERVICWTGSKVESRSQCTVPSGLGGLRWVYPSFDRDFETCEQTPDPTPAGKVRAWFCPFADNRREGVRYNEWRSPSDAEAYHKMDYRPYPPETLRHTHRQLGYIWRRLSPDEHDLVSATVAYRDWPFSVTVQSTRVAGLGAGCELVDIRSPRDFRSTLTGVCTSL